MVSCKGREKAGRTSQASRVRRSDLCTCGFVRVRLACSARCAAHLYALFLYWFFSDLLLRSIEGLLMDYSGPAGRRANILPVGSKRVNNPDYEVQHAQRH